MVSKLKDRGTHQAFGVITNAQDFLHVLRHFVEQLELQAAEAPATEDAVALETEAAGAAGGSGEAHVRCEEVRDEGRRSRPRAPAPGWLTGRADTGGLPALLERLGSDRAGRKASMSCGSFPTRRLAGFESTVLVLSLLHG